MLILSLIGWIVDWLEFVKRNSFFVIVMLKCPISWSIVLSCLVDLCIFDWWFLQTYQHIFFNPVEPFSFISSPILPTHLSISMSIVIFKISLIFGSIFPYIDSLPIFLIIHVFTFIGVAIYHMPNTSPMSHSWQELTSVIRSILPIVLSISFRSSWFIFANVNVSVGKYL